MTVLALGLVVWGVGPPARSAASETIEVTAEYDAFAVQNDDKTPQLTDVTVKNGPVCSYYDGSSSTGRRCTGTAPK